MSALPNFKINDTAKIERDGQLHTVKIAFAGIVPTEIHKSRAFMYGIVYDQPIGKHNGCQLFHCKPKHGSFVFPKSLKRAKAPEAKMPPSKVKLASDRPKSCKAPKAKIVTKPTKPAAVVPAPIVPEIRVEEPGEGITDQKPDSDQEDPDDSVFEQGLPPSFAHTPEKNLCERFDDTINLLKDDTDPETICKTPKSPSNGFLGLAKPKKGTPEVMIMTPTLRPCAPRKLLKTKPSVTPKKVAESRVKPGQSKLMQDPLQDYYDRYQRKESALEDSPTHFN